MKIGASTTPGFLQHTARTGLRQDFTRELERRLEGSLGAPGTERRARMEKAFEPMLREGRVDLDALPEEAQRELQRLQDASELFEAEFVRKLFSAMRSAAIAEPPSGMGELATDMFDRASAESAARMGGFGIARTLFLSVGDRVVKSSLASDHTTNRQ